MRIKTSKRKKMACLRFVLFVRVKSFCKKQNYPDILIYITTRDNGKITKSHEKKSQNYFRSMVKCR